jgi:hypothetical protein
MEGKIKIGPKTANHKAALEKLGYKHLRDEGEYMYFEVSGWERKVPTTLAEVQALVMAKKVTGYFSVNGSGGGRKSQAVSLMERLGAGYSCLVMSGAPTEPRDKAPKEAPKLTEDSLKALLNAS